MPSQQDRRWWLLFNFQFLRALNEPLLSFRAVPLFARHPISVASQRVGLRDAIQKIQLTLARQPAKRAIAHLLALLEKFAWFQMLTHERYHLRAYVVTIKGMKVQAIEKAFCRRHAG